MDKTEDIARNLFNSEDTPIAERDRTDYRRNFDAMPPGLRQWWCDRATRYERTSQRLPRT